MVGLHLTTNNWRDRATVAPVLPADLERAIEATRPYRTEGFVMEGQPPEYHPLSARYVLAYAERLEPASRDVIAQWITMLAATIPNRPRAETEFLLWQDGAMIGLGALPSGVWCQETLAEAIGEFTFWPAVAEVKKLLQSHADALRRTHAALQASADAPRDRPPSGPARRSTEPYIGTVMAPPSKDPQPWSPPEREHHYQPPVRTIAEQLEWLAEEARKEASAKSPPIAAGEMEYRSWFPRPDTP
jgi:hypothetical protein